MSQRVHLPQKTAMHVSHIMDQCQGNRINSIPMQYSRVENSYVDNVVEYDCPNKKKPDFEQPTSTFRRKRKYNIVSNLQSKKTDGFYLDDKQNIKKHMYEVGMLPNPLKNIEQSSNRECINFVPSDNGNNNNNNNNNNRYYSSNLNCSKGDMCITKREQSCYNHKINKNKAKDLLQQLMGNLTISEEARANIFGEIVKKENVKAQRKSEPDAQTTENLILERLEKSLLSSPYEYNNEAEYPNEQPLQIHCSSSNDFHAQTLIKDELLKTFLSSQLDKTSPDLLYDLALDIINKYYRAIDPIKYQINTINSQRDRWINSLTEAKSVWTVSRDRRALDDVTKMFIKKIIDEKNDSNGNRTKKLLKSDEKDYRNYFVKKGNLATFAGISDNVEDILTRASNYGAMDSKIHDTKVSPNKLTLATIFETNFNQTSNGSIQTNKDLKLRKNLLAAENRIAKEFVTYANINEPATKNIILETQLTSDDGTMFYVPSEITAHIESFNKEINKKIALDLN